jgi:hypothetical protein
MNLRTYSRFSRCLIFFLIILTNSLSAQSIYSRHGFGLPRYRDGVKAIGMGGVSLAIADSISLYFLNPATMARVNFTRVQGDFLYERARIKLDDASGLLHDANVNSAAILIPVKRGYVFAFGIQPFSRSEFEFNRSDTTALGSSFEEIFRGTGGINDLYLAFAANLGRVRVGLAGDFYFGTLRRIWRVNFADAFEFRNTEDVTNSNFTGLGLHAGVQTQFGSWQIGTAFGLPARLNVETNRTTVSRDTSETIESNLKLPLWWGVGFGYSPNRHWLLGADWRWQHWNAVARAEFLNEQGADSYDMSVGAEVTPSFDALDSPFKRLSYRCGATYRQLPYQEPIGSNLHEWVATFGLGLPFGRGLNRLDFAFEIGKRGSLSKNIAEENIVLFHASINGSERWFQRGPRR